MRLILTLIAVFYIIMGVLLVILTDATKQIIKNLLKNKDKKVLAVGPFIFGIILILGSSVVSTPWITLILGLLAITKGAFFMFGPEAKTRAMLDWWFNSTPNIQKSWGIVAFLVGVLLLLIL